MSARPEDRIEPDDPADRRVPEDPDEPTKMVLTESVSRGSRRLARGTRVWCLSRDPDGESLVEAIVWYERVIFIGDVPREEGAYVEFWERHRGLTTDELHLRAIGL